MAARRVKRAEEQTFNDVIRPMCLADQDREEAAADMAHEKANPSGYVDVVQLHDLGARVQAAREQLQALTPAYVKARHHAWQGWRTECRSP
jgi:hypothetical protein